jgi:hypothetical protein
MDDMAHETKSIYARSTPGFDELAGKDRLGAYADAADNIEKGRKLNTAWEAAKGYYAEPWKNSIDKTLSAARKRSSSQTAWC